MHCPGFLNTGNLIQPQTEQPPSAYLRAPSGLLSARSPQPAAPCLWAGPSAGGDAEGPPGTASPVLLLSTACWPPLLLSASSWFLHPPLFSSVPLFFNLPVFSGLAIFFSSFPFLSLPFFWPPPLTQPPPPLRYPSPFWPPSPLPLLPSAFPPSPSLLWPPTLYWPFFQRRSMKHFEL